MEPVILNKSDELIVVFKPSGWLSIPARISHHKAPVLSEWLEKKLGRIWVVHRLDLETSGVMLFARNAEKHRLLNYWFEERLIKKTYHCLAQGEPSLPVFKISTSIRKARASTQVEVLEKYANAFLAEAHPLTGKRHQIRIHFFQMGYPLFGDLQYSGRKEIELSHGKLQISRVALHSYSIEFPTGEVFQAPWSEDFLNWVQVLRLNNVSVEGQKKIYEIPQNNPSRSLH